MSDGGHERHGDGQYRVVCPDCGLDDPHASKDDAIDRGLAHNDATCHVARIEGGESA